ncbi:MAG: site-specific integrase [Burkholderiales bacterium]|nr:site-specific integrase [Burkholderiales bacterium]
MSKTAAKTLQLPKQSAEYELVYARDGEVVLYKRVGSQRWQTRFKLNDEKWHRISTKQRNLEYAKTFACAAYDKARFLREENLPVSSRRFNDVAKLASDEMQKQLDSGVGKSVYHSYIGAINRYLVPYFGKYNINTIGYEHLKSFDAWRTKEMGHAPVASTITTHTSALNRVFDAAVERGWLAQSQVPKMKNNGAKGTPREAFSLAEYNKLTSYMTAWAKKGHMEKTVHMRELLRDYVLILANTGMRHGTESLNMKWRDVEWILKGGERYLQFTVDGKTGKRTLIARHNAEDYLKRIKDRFDDLKKLEFDALLKRKLDTFIFRLQTGETTKSLNGTFRNLMRDSGLDKDKGVKEKRTLYSLRHTYAHFALLQDSMPIETLAKQMGTSVGMIEKHYGHITPAMKADVIAGPKMGKKKATA